MTVGSPPATNQSNSSPVAVGQLRPLRLSVAAKGSDFAWVYAARDLSLFQKQGLDAQVEVVSPSNSVAALVSGDLDLTATSGSVVRAALQGLPVRGIFVAGNRNSWALLGQKGLTSMDQLKGKIVSSDAPGTSTALILAALLQSKGLTPDQYTPFTGTTDDARLAALVNGTASAAIVNVSLAIPLVDQGYPLLANVSDMPETPSSGLGASQAALRSNRELIASALRAALDALTVMRTQPDAVPPVIAQEFDLSLADATQIYTSLASAYTTNGKPSPAATQFESTADQQALGLSTTVTSDQGYDFTLLDQVLAEGG